MCDLIAFNHTASLGFDDIIDEDEILDKASRLDIYTNHQFDGRPFCPGDRFQPGRGDVFVHNGGLPLRVDAFRLSVAVGYGKETDQDRNKDDGYRLHGNFTSNFGIRLIY